MESVKCTGKNCNNKKTCVRFLCEENDFNIKIDPPTDLENGCDSYWDSAQETIINLK